MAKLIKDFLIKDPKHFFLQINYFDFVIDKLKGDGLILIMRISLNSKNICTPGLLFPLFYVPKPEVSNPKINLGAPKSYIINQKEIVDQTFIPNISHNLADKIHSISGENLICGEIISHKTA